MSEFTVTAELLKERRESTPIGGLIIVSAIAVFVIFEAIKFVGNYI
jgi:hypothetical protein